MEQNIESKLEFKSILTNFYSFNKKKIFSFIFILIIIVISIFFIEHNKNKKNILIAEKYIQAGVYLSLQKKDNAKILYEEIILSKNEFYSTLSLNIIVILFLYKVSLRKSSRFLDNLQKSLLMYTLTQSFNI